MALWAVRVGGIKGEVFIFILSTSCHHKTQVRDSECILSTKPVTECHHKNIEWKLALFLEGRKRFSWSDQT